MKEKQWIVKIITFHRLNSLICSQQNNVKNSNNYLKDKMKEQNKKRDVNKRKEFQNNKTLFIN